MMIQFGQMFLHYIVHKSLEKKFIKQNLICILY